jgi:DNA-binding transcriptional LysR family regulator
VTSQVKATLTISAVESISTYVLPAHLAALREKWPGVRLEVAARVCAEIRESVAAGQSDLGLVLEVGGGSAESDESALATARLVIFGAPSHPLAGRSAPRKVSADELRRCDFYMSDAAGDYHHALRRHFDAAGAPPPRTQVLGSVEGVKRGILTGGQASHALGLLPAHAVKQELADGVFAEVRVSPPLPGLVLRAVLGPESGDSPLVGELVGRLRGLALG